VSVTIHLMRHGATAPEHPRRFLGRRDVPLSDEGRAQARAWREGLAEMDYAGAWCSDLSRSQETAGIILEGRGLAARPVPELGEISLGEWDGLTVDEVRERFPGQYEARGANMAGFRPPGGESFADVAGRAWPAFEAILAPYRDTPGANILIVAHAGVNRAILCRLLGIPLAGLFCLAQESCCLNIMELSDGKPGLCLLNQHVLLESSLKPGVKNAAS
jgi:probable phosphoglycerate mutase